MSINSLTSSRPSGEIISCGDVKPVGASDAARDKGTLAARAHRQRMGLATSRAELWFVDEYTDLLFGFRGMCLDQREMAWCIDE